MWTDCGTYEIYEAPQGEQDWLNAREALDLTASNFGAAIDVSKFCSSEQLRKYKRGEEKQVFTDDQKKNMANGVKYEPIIRNAVSKMLNIPFVEVGLARPKWDKRIGGSSDGVPGVLNDKGQLVPIKNPEVIAEFKTAKKMYQPLIKHKKRVDSGWEPPRYYHDYIWPSHYAQMQGCMKIIGAKYCVYGVLGLDTQTLHVEFVEYNEDYWNEIYPKIDKYIKSLK